ncbi:MAG: hypothetical protein QOH93_1481 [Chloroflexia bacterium]|jgi:C1A family cysteine protease|nr:hypothetical protein [Chloroflexia bacterium]
MGRFDFDVETANEATGFSGFGGHRLVQIQTGEEMAFAVGEDAADGYVSTLAALGIEDAEQLVALAAVPDIQGELETTLGLKKKDFRSLLSQAQETLPPERLALVSNPAPRDVGLGVLPPTEEMITAAESSFMLAVGLEGAVALPASVNLIPYMSAIRNQRSRGTCVAFTLTALNEYSLRRRGMTRDLSEQHLYYETKLIDGAPGGCGTWQAKAVLVLRDRGECREVIWPYDPNPPCNNHGVRPTQARPDGLNYKLNTIAVAARDVASYKAHMSKKRPVGISIPVYNSWYQSAETRRSGRITMRVGNETAVGGHALLLVGYQDSPNSPGGGYFLVRNHWGTTWGSQCPYGAGYGTIPYQYITNECWEAYTAAVPGMPGDEGNQEEQEQEGDEQLTAGPSTITIDVSPNIKITISSK